MKPRTLVAAQVGADADAHADSSVPVRGTRHGVGA